MGKSPDNMPEELAAFASRLRDERPEATAVELDRMKRRAVAKASAPSGASVPRKGLFMKPRIAVVFMLAVGLLMSGTGATLAVISDTTNAGSAQYPDLGNVEEGADLLGPQESGQAPERAAGNEPQVQEERQVASSGGGQELPFTGFLAIPLLIVGVLLLVAGGFMRTRTGAPPDA